MNTLRVEDPELQRQLQAAALSFEAAHFSPVPGGDAAWLAHDGRRIGLERKRADDLVRSWASGHLADQLQRMAPNYDVVILLQEGQVWPDSERQIVAEIDFSEAQTHIFLSAHSFDALMNDLQTWQDAGLRYQVTALGDAGRRVWSLFRYYQKAVHRATERGRLKVGAASNLLTTPGLGPKRAEALIRALATLPGADAEVLRVLGKGAVGKAFQKRLQK